MLNNSTAVGPPHFVDLHVNPGESVSIQLFDGNETVLRGPATVTMISQHSFPPVPMPVQVPPGHMVQQIVDENGTLRHIILSAINGNGTNSSSTTLVPQQQTYPYSCCCYCYCSSMPSSNPLPTPPPPPPPPPPIHHNNLWEMGLTHVDSTRRLPFSSRSSNSKVNGCNLEMTFPSSPTAAIRRRLPSNRNYSYTKRSPPTTTTTISSNVSTATTTTTTTTSINNSTSFTITTTSSGTSPSSNSHHHHHHSNSFVVNGVTTITTTKTSSGLLSIAALTSTTSPTTTTTTTVAAISSTTTTNSGSSTYNNLINSRENSGSIPIRGINGKSQTLTVTVTESSTGTVNSKTGAITFPVNHSRTNGGSGGGGSNTVATKSVPELITSTEISTKHHTHHSNHHHHQQHQHPHGYQHHQYHAQSPKIEFLFSNNSGNNSVTSGGYNTNYNNKHNSIVSNLPSSTASNHHHHYHHHHNIVTHGGNNGGGDSNKLMMIDNEKLKITSTHHNNKDTSSSISINRNTTPTTSTSTNGLLIGTPSSPIKSVGVKGLNSIPNGEPSSTTTTPSIQSLNYSPKNDNASRKLRRDDKMKDESIKSNENVTPSRKKSNNINNVTTINGNGGGNHECEIERNSSGASSSSNSKESSPIKIPLNRLNNMKSPLQSSSFLPAINIPINVTLETGPQSSSTSLPINSVPLESSKKQSDSLITNTTTVSSVDSAEVKNRKESKESFTLTGNSINKSNARNLNNRDQQSITGSLPITVIINDADNLSVESPLMESDTKSIDKLSTKPNVLKGIDDIEDKGDDDDINDNGLSTIQRISSKKGSIEFKKRRNDLTDGQFNRQSEYKEETFNDNSVIHGDDGTIDMNKDPLKDEINGDNESTLELNCKNDDKIDSQQLKPSSSSTTTTLNDDVNRVTVPHGVHNDSVSTSASARDNLDKDLGDKKVECDDNEDNHEEEDDADEDEDEDEEEDDLDDDNDDQESQLTGVDGGNKQNNYITTTGLYADSIDVNRVKAKSSPQRSPKHLLPQIQVFCLNYISLTATSVKLKWINEQGHHHHHHHQHHQQQQQQQHNHHHYISSYGGNGSILSEARHYMVEMMKLNRTNAKNGTVTPTTRIVYQGTQASCRISHLTPSEQYSFRVRSSENNHQLVSNVLTLVTPEHQPVNKHHKRSRTQNTNQQIQFASESSSQKQQHTIQTQEQAASRQQESLNNKIDGETRIIRSEQKCAIVIISLVSVLAVVLACIIHNLLMY